MWCWAALAWVRCKVNSRSYERRGICEEFEKEKVTFENSEEVYCRKGVSHFLNWKKREKIRRVPPHWVYNPLLYIYIRLLCTLADGISFGLN